MFSHPVCALHETPPGHPERSERMKAVLDALAAPAFAGLVRVEAPLVAPEAILRVHPEDYVDAIRASSPMAGLVGLDPDTTMGPHSLEAAERAAGAATAAVDAVFEGRAANAFVACRPPGHHAERSRAMGFCLFNAAAIAARHAQVERGARKVAIVDFDVHHGNGAQDVFWDDPSVLYSSTHEMPLYPGTGAREEAGAHGQIVNAPLRAGDGGSAFRAAMEQLVLPRVEAFAPDLLIVSAGFDAHRRDPLAHLELEEGDFAWATSALAAVARRACGGRLVSLLEGGYDLEGLGRSAAAHVGALMAASDGG
ncbi:MAG: histone deacetylase family protein [Hyphomicrobiales bacterium]|nr:histone deacetylase family protein [Hyphomicrobiales bacterium]